MFNLSDALEMPGAAGAFGGLRLPDLWQQEAVAALRAGKDVVVHAPTGAGKTLIFELWSNDGRPIGPSIYTVPTRALANDKLAEWRGRRWNVGIATGDLAENLDAPVLVATLETQKNRLIRGDGPRLLVVDEYQMIGDADRGLNYEMALALAPERTQLLLLSGSVHNPQQVAAWLNRIGREAVVVRHEERPVPQEEVWADQLPHRVPSEVKGYWPRLMAKALAEGLGPVLVFAPRRRAAEKLAAELARNLPVPEPLNLTPEQRRWAGEDLTRLLKSRVAYHHSGLSYAARAGVVEPLAKAGQLRVVVATMGLAAGINFSLRSVALAGDSYRRDLTEQPLRPDEILQMFGRAGRRGLDETGYVLVNRNEIRLRDGHPGQLTRNGLVDWGALLNVMAGAADRGEDPYAVAVRVQQRLFTSKPLRLGVEAALEFPEAACGLRTDAERARRVRSRVREMRNSKGDWESAGPLREVPAGLVFAVRSSVDTAPSTASTELGEDGPVEWVPALSVPAALERLGQGDLVVLQQGELGPVHGRETTLAEKLPEGQWELVRWVRRMIGWRGRQATRGQWDKEIRPKLEAALANKKTPLVRVRMEGDRMRGQLSLAKLGLRVAVDGHGLGLWQPPMRERPHPDCLVCPQRERCLELTSATGTAAWWRRLELVDDRGVPTRRGRVVAALSQSAGLAMAAAMEDEGYPLDELVYDLANLDAGFRFAGVDSRWGGRMAVACQRAYGLVDIPGYLESGLPPKYGAGAQELVQAAHKQPHRRPRAVGEFLGEGDVDRLIIEWRSLLRQIAHAPGLDWARWRAFQAMAKGILAETESPTLQELPALTPSQNRRMDHRLVFRRF